MIDYKNTIESRLESRHKKERRFKILLSSTSFFVVAIILVILGSIVFKSIGAFYQHEMNINIVNSDFSSNDTNYRKLARSKILAMFPEVKSRRDKKKLFSLISINAEYELKQEALNNYKKNGAYKILLSDKADQYLKGNLKIGRKIDKKQAIWLETLERKGVIEAVFSYRFFTNTDSRYPESAGIKGGIVGSLLIVLITLVFSLIVGVFTAIYLEEFAKKNKFTDLIEININNLASVPSIVFGLLGLSVFIGFFGLHRSSPIVGGLTLGLMTLPTIILSTRSALKTVPYSLKEAALGLGASKMETIFHHTLPYAMPGIITGVIIGISQAIGETAPLIMIGMVAFVADLPSGINDVSTALPVQIYIWSNSPEQSFTQKVAGAIVILLGFLILMNLASAILRNHFEKKNKL